MMPDFEKLGVLYLGRTHDLQHDQTTPDLLLYESKDLTTHAVCVGMTGSGKTGLCLSLLEEAAIDGIPAIAIDPKGDLGNLLLAFPELQPGDFLPWIEEGEATRQGMTPDQHAAHVANQWRDGLAAWGQDGARIERYRSAVDFSIYTPGSNAGLPLTVLRSFDAPLDAVRNDAEALLERVSTSVSGLLALLGIDADPLRSREHILLSNLFDRAWREGRNLDLPGLIREIQQPPFDKIGVMDLDLFFPSNDRFSLALALNNLLGSPSFANWLEGEPLDVKRLLYTPQGKPRLSIISIAHLSESERMFFVTILLNEILAWTRSQAGTSSLRALLYMDEVFGYFPPVANPPSKKPMLTLLKQARAYGLGIVLATQNPVDLDYKGLSNTGTWFLGRLQTERDKARVLEGLEGAAAQTGTRFDRQRMEETLSALGKRVFLMNNVHDDEPTIFHTRWALSYLRGPLTRQQIQTLMSPRKAAAAGSLANAPSRDEFVSAASPPALTTPPVAERESAQRPVIPQEASECFLAIGPSDVGDGRLVYRPALLSVSRLHFVRATYKVDQWRTVTLLRSLHNLDSPDEQSLRKLWEQADPLAQEPRFDNAPGAGCRFATPPRALTMAKNYKSWRSDLRDYLYRQNTLTVWKCPALKKYSEAGEAEDDFRIRLAHLAKERRDLKAEKLRKRYASKLAGLQDRIRAAEARVDREKSQQRTQQYQSAISIGASVLGALFGRKLASTTNVSRAGSALRSAGRAERERGDVARAEESVKDLQRKLEELEAEFQQELDAVEQTIRADQMELEELQVRPRKSDIDVDRCSLVWTPWRVDSQGIAEPLFSPSR